MRAETPAGTLSRSTVVLLCAAAVTLPLSTASSAGAADDTCQGRPATIVGPTSNGSSAPHLIEGTSGDDVIVTNGAGVVYAGSGNDLICTTNTDQQVHIAPGFGVDVVDTTNDNPGTVSFTYLAPVGDASQDTFVGGPGQDIVYLSDPIGLDVIDTGSGEDVLTLSCAMWTAGNFRADLGPGDDQFVLEQFELPLELRFPHPAVDVSCQGPPRTPDGGRAFIMDGGPGRNSLIVDQTARQRVTKINLIKGLAISKHVRAGTLIGFSDVNAASVKLRVVGDKSGNDITWVGCKGGARGLEGKDTVRRYEFDCNKKHVGQFRVTGGPGNDKLIGGTTDDILDGGPGHDRARAGKGRDVCLSTEVEAGCEVTH